MQPRIIYSVIIRGQSVTLSECAIADGTYRQFVRTIAQKVDSGNVKKSYLYDQYEFHIWAEDNYIFMVMAEKGVKLRIAFAYLEDIKNQFFKKYPSNIRDNAIDYALNEEFTRVQRERLDYYNSPDNDKLALIKGNIDATKNIMLENLDKLLERGEKIELLVEKTNLMLNISTDMKKNATTLKRDMWWRNKKITLICILVGILAIWFITSLACGFGYQNC